MRMPERMMGTRSTEEWPYAALSSARWSTISRWEDPAKAPVTSTGWMRWSVIGLFLAIVAISVVSGVAPAAHDQRAGKRRPAPVETFPNDAASDPHLQELLREHHRAVFSGY
jgi:hypothetical protein